MTDDVLLKPETTYSFIVEAARERRFVSYGQLAEANGTVWPNVRHQMPRHLDKLVTIAAERHWPLLTAIVVNQNDVKTGKLEGTAREGFITAAREAGYDVSNPDEFVKEQQRQVFEWAKTAPDLPWARGLLQQPRCRKRRPPFCPLFRTRIGRLEVTGR